MGQKITKKICKRLHKKYNKHDTKRELRKRSVVDPFYSLKSLTKDQVIKILETEHVRTFDDLVSRRLSLPGRKHWGLDIEFDQFFIDLIPEMSKYIKVDADIIKSFE